MTSTRASKPGRRKTAAKARAKQPAKLAKPAKPVRAKARKKPAKLAKPAKPPKSRAKKPAKPRAAKRPPAKQPRAAKRASPVVAILDAAEPIAELRAFLARTTGALTEQQAQIALGAAQLLLLPVPRDGRGGSDVTAIVDLVLDRWRDFGATRGGFHAQELLRNALAAIGDDRPRIARLAAVVPPGASSELLFHVAQAYAVAGDKRAMLAAAETALAAGATPAEFRRDADLAAFAADPDLATLLARADLPAIPVDVEPHLPAVRTALHALIAALAELGEPVELHAPVRLDAILDAERAARISLPNDYRALLATTNGLRAWGREFLATTDFREPTSLALRARRYLQADHAPPGRADCVPLACWGGPNDWLLYDPRGRVRRGTAGYVVAQGPDDVPIADLASALIWLEALAREERATN